MAKSAQDRRVYTPSTHGAVRDRRPGHSSYRTVCGVDRPHHPARPGGQRRGPGRPAVVSDAELVCWPWPKSCCAITTNTTGCGPHLPGRAPVSQAAVPARLQPPAARGRRPDGRRAQVAGRHTPATAELLRLLDGTRCLWPLADHRQAFQPCRLGRLRPRHLHPCCYWGSRLLLLTTPDGTVTGFGLANPKQLGERQAVVAMLGGWRPTGRHLARCWWATRALPAATSRPPWPSWSLAWCARPAPTSPMLRLPQLAATADRGDHLDPQAPAGSGPSRRPHPGRAVGAGGAAPARLNAAIWFNWQIGAPTKRSLVAYDH